MLSIKIDKQASKKLLEVLENAPQKVQDAVSTGLFRIGQEFRGEAQRLAPYKTGKLRQSITVDPVRPKNKVSVGTNLVYARIQDQGGVITPKRAKFLRFKVNGKWVMTKKSVIPKYKGKGYLTPAFQTQEQGRAEKIMLQEFDNIIK
jgi:phage gpG-like protein